jgi:hypothetical protein
MNWQDRMPRTVGGAPTLVMPHSRRVMSFPSTTRQSSSGNCHSYVPLVSYPSVLWIIATPVSSWHFPRKRVVPVPKVWYAWHIPTA